MVKTNTQTITLDGTEQEVQFNRNYPYFWAQNQSDGDVLISINSGIAEGKDGVIVIPAGGSSGTMHGYDRDRFYLLGTGKVQVMGTYSAHNPFWQGKKGGGSEVSHESSYTLTNAVDYPILGLNLYGKSTQDGTPTPDNPVDIVSVGDSGSLGVTACGKNLIPFPYLDGGAGTVKEINGITFTVLDDGGIKVSGICTGSTYFNLCIKNFGNYNVQANATTAQTKNGFTFSPRLGYTAKTVLLFLRFFENEIIDEIFYPQVEPGDTATDYEPYHGTTANITSAMPLCGIPVSDGGNYTDSNGQQWVCDELIYNADGTGKIIKNIRKYTFTGTDEGGQWLLNSTVDNTKKRFQFKITDENIKPVYDSGKFTSSSPSIAICDKYSAVTTQNTYSLINGVSCSHTAGYLTIYDENHATISTINDWIAHLAENPVTVVYQLNKPQEIELTAAEMTALNVLRTFEGVTNISNDSGADMDVKYCTNKMLSEYVVPITVGMQKQIDELKSAVLSLGGNV